MNSDNKEALDYFLLPRIDLLFDQLILKEENPCNLETYRFDTLDFFFGMARRAHVRAA